VTSAEHHAYRRNVIVSVLLTCVGYACYNVGDVAVKIMAEKFHFSQFFFTNGCFIFVFMVIYGWLKEGKKTFRTKKPGLMFARAFLGQIVGLCNIAALPKIHLATFYTLIFTSPFWVAVLSAYFLNDKLNRHRILTILAGFAVILFMFRPGGALLNIWSVLVSISAFLYAGQMVLVRHIGSAESRPFMIMIGSAMSICLAAPFLPSHYIPPTPYEWGLFGMMGISGSIGLLCMTYAFQTAPSASIVAPYHYTQIIWGTLFGYLIFHEIPKTEVTIGASLIILLGIYLIHSETRRFADTLKPLKN
jgi:drug/metabolite transporter (DMT)-like permease